MSASRRRRSHDVSAASAFPPPCSPGARSPRRHGSVRALLSGGVAWVGRSCVRRGMAAARGLVAVLLQPLSAARWLLNNRGLQAAYNELALAEADMVEASLPPNPRISFRRIADRTSSRSSAQIVADILALATLPARRRLRASASVKRNCAPPRRRFASHRHAARLLPRGGGAELAASWRRRNPRPKPRRSSPRGWARPAR